MCQIPLSWRRLVAIRVAPTGTSGTPDGWSGNALSEHTSDPGVMMDTSTLEPSRMATAASMTSSN